jgi:hypothetical protein
MLLPRRSVFGALTGKAFFVILTAKFPKRSINLRLKPKRADLR